MSRALLAAATALLGIGVSLGGAAQERTLLGGGLSGAPFTLHADQITYEPDRDLYEASGHVRIEQPGGGSLRTDWLVFNGKTRVGVASGNVAIVQGSDTVAARFAAVNLQTLVALATDASLDTSAPGFVVEGEAIRKTGVETYRVEEGTFTTCRCPPGPDGRKACRPWEIQAGEADIRVGGYAVAHDVSFRVREIPVLYTPLLVLPVKTERQTGFLFPGYSRDTRSGTSLELPFFWAARDDLNVLLRPTWISKRGFKSALELEYVQGEQGGGSGGASLLAGDDTVEEASQETPFSDNRWTFWWRHQQPLGPATQLGIDLVRVSDNQYVVDFEELPGQTRYARFLQSSAWLTAAHGPWFGMAEASVPDDLQSPENLDRDAFLLRRLPDVWLSLLPLRIGGLPLRAGVDLRYTYFQQKADTGQVGGISPVDGQFFDTGQDGLFDFQEPSASGTFGGVDNSGDNSGSQGDGVFEEGELLADHGHRIDLYPRLTLARRLGPLETLSEVGFRETFYDADRGGIERREIWTGRWDARMRFERDLALGGTMVRHLLEPRLAFALVSTPGQGSNPLFIPRGSVRLRRLIDADIRLLTRDPSDRSTEERVLQFSVDNRFYARAASGGTRPPRQVAWLRVGSGYNFLRDRMENLFVTGDLRPRNDLTLSTELGVDPEKPQIEEALVSLAWTPASGNELRASYRYLRDFADGFENFNVSDEVFDDFDASFNAVSQLSLAGRWVVSRRVELFGDGYASFDSQESARGVGTLGALYRSPCNCWQLVGAVTHRGRPSETRFEITFQLTGLGQTLGRSYSRTYTPRQEREN